MDRQNYVYPYHLLELESIDNTKLLYIIVNILTIGVNIGYEGIASL
jgi:hypothetical protein